MTHTSAPWRELLVPEYIESVLTKGAVEARKATLLLVRKVRDAVGLPNP